MCWVLRTRYFAKTEITVRFSKRPKSWTRFTKAMKDRKYHSKKSLLIRPRYQIRSLCVPSLHQGRWWGLIRWRARTWSKWRGWVKQWKTAMCQVRARFRFQRRLFSRWYRWAAGKLQGRLLRRGRLRFPLRRKNGPKTGCLRFKWLRRSLTCRSQNGPATILQFGRRLASRSRNCLELRPRADANQLWSVSTHRTRLHRSQRKTNSNNKRPGRGASPNAPQLLSKYSIRLCVLKKKKKHKTKDLL